MKNRTIDNHDTIPRGRAQGLPAPASQAIAGTGQRRIGLPASLLAIQLVLAYEWLLSGINKLVNPSFTTQLAGNLRQSIDGNSYGWYTGFLRDVVLPHATIFGFLTELGETAIGVTLIVSAIVWLRRPHSRLALYAGGAACMALVGATFLSLNYFFQGGSPLPWVNPGSAFGEGVDIDILIPLLSATLFVANLRTLRSASARLAAARSTLRTGMTWAF